MRVPAGFDAVFRQLTPLVLLGVLVAVIFDWVPGAGWLRQQFGDDVVLRGCVAVLGCYVLILWGEALRLNALLGGVLGAFRQFDQERGGKGDAAAKNPKARLEAARLLIAALRSDDPSIRQTSRHNLTRLVGEDLGDDPAAWQQWLQRQSEGTGRS